MLRVLDYSSISYMPVRGGKPFGKHTMSVRFYKRMGAGGVANMVYKFVCKKSQNTGTVCAQIRTTATDAKIGAWHNRR